MRAWVSKLQNPSYKEGFISYKSPDKRYKRVFSISKTTRAEKFDMGND